MQTVREREDEKKAAAGIGRQKNAGGRELAPGDYLPGEEKQPEDRGNAPPMAEGVLLVRQKIFPGTREREAAGQEDQCVQPEDPRNFERLPITVRKAFSHNESADERDEEHQNSAQGDDDAGYVGPLRDIR